MIRKTLTRTTGLALASLWLSLPAYAYEGMEPEIDHDMLVFESQDHFDGVMRELILRQEILDEEGREDDDRLAPVFQDFANDLGFESMLVYVEWLETGLEGKSDEEGGLNESNDPDERFVADPYLRGVLNPQGEIRLGESIYKLMPQGVYEIKGDFEALDLIRQGESVESESVVFTAYKHTSHHCCFSSESNTTYTTYANNSRRIKAKHWVGNWPFYSSIGARTTNYRRKSNGNWKRERADSVGVWGSFGFSLNECGSPGPAAFHKVKSNKKSVSYVSPWINTGNTIFVEDYFDSTHTATDNGGSVTEVLSMCECREATASFTLPSTAMESSNVTLDGSASEDEDRYFLEIFRTNAVGSNTNQGGYWSSWFSGTVGTVNLSSFYSFDDTTGSGTVYRVKLAVQNGCTVWHQQVRWITIHSEDMDVTYRAHVKSLGWRPWVWNGATAGTTGQNRRMEAAQIKLVNAPSGTGICYRAHVKGNGWLGTVCNGSTAGTTGQNRRMEAIQVWLTNPPAGCGVETRAHVKGLGWLPWVSNGSTAGTTGQNRRMEAMQVRLVGTCP